MNLLQSQWGSLFTNTEDFTGRPLGTDDGRYITWVSQENRQHFFGHMMLLGLAAPGDAVVHRRAERSRTSARGRRPR